MGETIDEGDGETCEEGRHLELVRIIERLIRVCKGLNVLTLLEWDDRGRR